MWICSGMDLTDPKELEMMRNQLEDAQRWNASLQARLGAIQNRGGGVGGTSDAGTTNPHPIQTLKDFQHLLHRYINLFYV